MNIIGIAWQWPKLGGDMKIKIKITENFGNEAIYPVCQNAQTVADIAGTKTLTRSTLKSIQSLGYEIDIAQQTL